MLEAVIQKGKQSPCAVLIKSLHKARSLRHLKKKLIELTTEQMSSLDYLVFFFFSLNGEMESSFAMGELQGKMTF